MNEKLARNGAPLIFSADGYKFPDVYHRRADGVGEKRSAMRMG